MNSSANEETLTVGLVGFGEAGQAIAKSLRKEKSINICAFDKNFCSEISIKKQYTKTKIKLFNNPKKLAEKANIIISVVTAEQSANAAKKISKHLNKNHIYLDGNSVSPGTKIKTNKIIKNLMKKILKKEVNNLDFYKIFKPELTPKKMTREGLGSS